LPFIPFLYLFDLTHLLYMYFWQSIRDVFSAERGIEKRTGVFGFDKKRRRPGLGIFLLNIMVSKSSLGVFDGGGKDSPV
jgi:hypothetical protein